MSTVVNAKVAGTVEMNNNDIPSIDAPSVSTKPIVIPPFRCKWVKRLVESLPAHSYQVNVTSEPIESHQVTWGIMASSTYGVSGSRRVGMMLRNLSAQEVRIPPKTVIGNVQTAEIIPNMKAIKHTSKVLPSKE